MSKRGTAPRIASWRSGARERSRTRNRKREKRKGKREKWVPINDGEVFHPRSGQSDIAPGAADRLGHRGRIRAVEGARVPLRAGSRGEQRRAGGIGRDRKSTRLNSS